MGPIAAMDIRGCEKYGGSGGVKGGEQGDLSLSLF